MGPMLAPRTLLSGCLVPYWRLAITWTNVEQDTCRHMTISYNKELIRNKHLGPNKCSIFYMMFYHTISRQNTKTPNSNIRKFWWKCLGAGCQISKWCRRFDLYSDICYMKSTCSYIFTHCGRGGLHHIVAPWCDHSRNVHVGPGRPACGGRRETCVNQVRNSEQWLHLHCRKSGWQNRARKCHPWHSNLGERK